MHDVSVTRGPCAGVDEPLIGIVLVEPFPFDDHDRERRRRRAVGGTDVGRSACTTSSRPGDLTSGRTIAGTGAIDLDGQRRADRRDPRQGRGRAQSADADILLVPRDNFDELRDVDTGISS